MLISKTPFGLVSLRTYGLGFSNISSPGINFPTTQWFLTFFYHNSCDLMKAIIPKKDIQMHEHTKFHNILAFMNCQIRWFFLLCYSVTQILWVENKIECSLQNNSEYKGK